MMGNRMIRYAIKWLSIGMAVMAASAGATPANKAALVRYYGAFLPTNLNSCTTCHLPAKLDHPPEDLDEFPHNDFGKRLRALGKELSAAGKPKDLATRLALIAREDADSDGVPNEAEILLGHNPGERVDKPAKAELAALGQKQRSFAAVQKKYRWEPFLPVRQPDVPKVFVEVPSRASMAGRAGAALNAERKTRQPLNWGRNPIDAFIAAEHQARGLKSRPEAPKAVLLRRVYLDLIGLTPTLEEQKQFEADDSIDAYEKVVNRLLDDPRYGERWARHWMDIWRYSDWAGWSGGNQIRDSKPHIWRWRDWIIESLNNDKGYDRMVVEMLAADELAPEDTNALPATGFLVRNYKMLSREQWLEDTVKHTSQAFLGLTVGCAKCHNHMFDPISQKDYYHLRAIFEPHQVRTDRIPGQLDTAKDGLVRVYDTTTNALTYFFPRGDERKPDTNQVMRPGVPALLAAVEPTGFEGGRLDPKPIALPNYVAHPDRRPFVLNETEAAAEHDLAIAHKKLETAKASMAKGNGGTNAVVAEQAVADAEAALAVAKSHSAAVKAVLAAERLEYAGKKQTAEWKEAAGTAWTAQQKEAVAEAEQKLLTAQRTEGEATNKVETARPSKAKDLEKLAKSADDAKKKREEAAKALASAKKNLEKEPTTAYKPRSTDDYPDISTGRRLAFAQWLVRRQNPLTARVAVNHIWLRHFGQGIVPTPHDFGANGRPPSHPALLDWLAAELMARGWKMKELHRLIVTSSTYRMSSTPDAADLKIDPDNVYFWRMPSKRMEAELVRDNLLYIGGNLDLSMGGPEIDHNLGLTSKRRSVYLRTAAEKEVEFLKLFDNASVTECYMRKPSVMPQQALALANSDLAIKEATILAEKFQQVVGNDPDAFIKLACRTILARDSKPEETQLCREFLQKPAHEQQEPSHGTIKISTSSRSGGAFSSTRARDLILVLFNHNDFVSIR